MTTARQVKKHTRRLLAANDDLALAGRMIVVEPLGHYLRGLFFDATRRRNNFDIHVLLLPLFTRQVAVAFTTDREVDRLDEVRSARRLTLLNEGYRVDDLEDDLQATWDWNRPGIDDELQQRIENAALPWLRGLDTMEKCFEADLPAECRENHYRIGREFLSLLALGRLEEAAGLMNAFPRDRLHVPERMEAKAPGLGERLPKLGSRISARDRKAISAYLSETEMLSAEALGIARLWRKTRYPLDDI